MATGAERKRWKRQALAGAVVATAAATFGAGTTAGAGAQTEPAAGAATGDRIVFSRRTDPTGSFDLWIMDGDGSQQRQLTAHPGDELQATASPDGRFVAYVRALKGEFVAANPTGTISILDLSDGTERPLVRDPQKDYKPSWSADGKRIAFSRETGSSIDIFAVDAADIGPDGSTLVTPIAVQPDPENYPSWSPSGRSLAFVLQASSVAIVDVDGTRRLHTVGQSPQWRPLDETTIAYQLVDSDGDLDLYTVGAAPGSVPRRLFDTDDAHERFVAWSWDGSRLGYARVPREGDCAVVQLARCPSQIYVVPFGTVGAGTPVAVGAVPGFFDNYPAFVPRPAASALPQQATPVPGAPSGRADGGSHPSAEPESRGSGDRTGRAGGELPVTGGHGRRDVTAATLTLTLGLVLASQATRRRPGPLHPSTSHPVPTRSTVCPSTDTQAAGNERSSRPHRSPKH